MRARLGTWYSRGVCRCLSSAVGRLPSGPRRSLHLTFDDGPTAQGTPRLLDVLDEFSLQATFFLLGENARKLPHLVREIVARGHVVGNHTMTHVDAWKVPTETLSRELDDCQQLLQDLTGQPIEWIRPPFGRMTRNLVAWAASHDRRIMLWDLMPPDFEPDSTPESVSRVFQNGLRSRSIVVLHDNAKSLGVTDDALKIAIPSVVASGWTIAGPLVEAVPLADAA